MSKDDLKIGEMLGNGCQLLFQFVQWIFFIVGVIPFVLASIVADWCGLIPKRYQGPAAAARLLFYGGYITGLIMFFVFSLIGFIKCLH